MTGQEIGLLNPLAVNALRTADGVGEVWGARTLNGGDAAGSEYKYIPVRRMALFIHESLRAGLGWVVFEPNDEPLWAQIRMSVGTFMHSLFLRGAFQGQKASVAYLVKCDRDTTSQEDIHRGVVNVVVGFAPLRAGEFVVLRVQQLTGRSDA